MEITLPWPSFEEVPRYWHQNKFKIQFGYKVYHFIFYVSKIQLEIHHEILLTTEAKNDH